MTPREVCRSSKMFKTAAEAESALADLVEAGFGQWEQAPPGRQGGRPSKRFVLASADDGDAAQSSDAATDVDNTPAGDLKNEGIVNVDGVDEPQAQSVPMEDANREAFRL